MNYLIFDIETYPDKALVEAVYGKSYAKVKEESEHLLHPLYHIPIVIGGLGCDENLTIRTFGAKCGGGEEEILRYFWQTFERYGGGKRGPQCVLVSFNGRCFDLPVIEHRSLRYGLGSAAYFNNRDRFNNYRYRYAPEFHFDIVEFLTNYGAAQRPALDAVAKLLGLPGKTGMEGARVEAEYEHGRLKEIADYCMCDVALTYFIFLECQRMRGLLRAPHAKAYAEAVEFFRNQLAAKPFLEELVRAGERRVQATQAG